MSRLLLLSGLILLGVGCASSQASLTGAPGQPLGHPAWEPLRVEGQAITGPTSSLLISGEAMRGRFRDIPISLQWTWQELTGTVGSSSTRLELAEGDDTRIWGNFGGVPVDLTLDKGWLYGRVGGCRYALQRNEAGFVGERSCSGPLEGALQVDFPASLLERPLGEKAALVTLVLADFSRPSASILSLARFTRPGPGVLLPPVKSRQ
jgi:hypothetical protein